MSFCYSGKNSKTGILLFFWLLILKTFFIKDFQLPVEALWTPLNWGLAFSPNLIPKNNPLNKWWWLVGWWWLGSGRVSGFRSDKAHDILLFHNKWRWFILLGSSWQTTGLWEAAWLQYKQWNMQKEPRVDWYKVESTVHLYMHYIAR